MDETELEMAKQRFLVERPLYEEFAVSLRGLIGQLCGAVGVRADNVTSRVKEPASFEAKVRKRRYTDPGQVVDRCGIRVIVRYRSDVDTVCELLTREFDVLETVRHGMESVERFGYASSHLVLRLDERRTGLPEWRAFEGLVVEIQVRSILQHAWASISHRLDYKSSAEVPQQLRRRLYRVAALLEAGDETFDLFRTEVGTLRDEYRTVVSDRDWRELPLDLDSLNAAWDRIPWREVRRAAESAGWSPGRIDLTDRQASAAQALLSRLLTVAGHANLRVLGELAGYADRAVEDAGLLKRLAEKSRTTGHIPHAEAPDVIALMIIAERAGLFLRRPDSVDSAFVGQLWVATLGSFGEVTGKDVG